MVAARRRGNRRPRTTVSLRRASLAIQTIAAFLFAAVFYANHWHGLQFAPGDRGNSTVAASATGKSTDGAVSASAKEERGFTVDILSVGSVTRQELLNAQKRTFASHVSVRNFFNVTERDDPDPDCHEKLTLSQTREISNYCRNQRPVKDVGETYRFIRGLYARWPWLEKKANPVGWMCAQQRPHAGMMKVHNHYKTSGQNLPDYLLVTDDDTYINMKTFEREFGGSGDLRPRRDLSPPTEGEPLVMAGCLVRQPVKQLNFTFPFGGFGTFISRGALQELYRPIYCDPSAPEYRQALHEDKCKQLDRDLVKEKHFFKDGMSIMELMHSYVTLPRYTDVRNWDVDNHYCLHSDHAFGVFLNFYNISQHVKDPWYRNVPQARVWSYKDSEIYAKPRGVCKNSLTELGCKAGVEVCHYATPQWMEFETKKWINAA